MGFAEATPRQRVLSGPMKHGLGMLLVVDISRSPTRKLPTLLFSPERDLVQLRPRRIFANVEVTDIGYGFGGLLIVLTPTIPSTLILGLRSGKQIKIFTS